MKTKLDFIIDLLSCEKLSVSDRERILKLSASEFQNNEEEMQKVWQEVQRLKVIFKTENEKLSSMIDSVIESFKGVRNNESIQINTSNNDSSKDVSKKQENISHTPQLTSKHLSLFKEDAEGNDLKYTTHLYPNRENDQFDYERITNNAIKIFNTFAKEIPRKLMGIINRFLRENKKEPEENTITYLGKKYETWSSPKIKTWCKTNPGRHPSTDQNLNEHIIEPFKKSIEFRNGNEFKKALNFKLSQTFEMNQINQLIINTDGVKDSFRVYTAVDQFMTGVAQLFDPIFKRTSISNNVHIYTDFEILKEADEEVYCKTLYIVHKGSNVPFDWNENMDFVNGNLLGAKMEFISLVDWQILANFKNGTYGFFILSTDSNSKVEKMSNPVDGFTHKLIFYP